MITTIHQPNYLPWLGFFDKIIKSDLFIILDDVEYSKNCFINRNKIKTTNGDMWLSLPVLYKSSSNINEILLDNKQAWKRTHKNSIINCYSKSKFFKKYWPEIESYYDKDYDKMVDITVPMIKLFTKILDINTEIVLSSTLDVNTRGSDRILDICKKVNATTYISGANGKDYLKKEDFVLNNINITFQEYSHPMYNQRFDNVIPYMSIIDLLFNEGENSKNIILN